MVRHDIEVCLIDIDGLPGFHRLSGPQNCGKGGWFGQRPHIESRLSLPGATGPCACVPAKTIWTAAQLAGVDHLCGRPGHDRPVWRLPADCHRLYPADGGEVQQRTAELADTNQQLQTQLDATRKAEANVSYLALHDSLTGLPNRPAG
jgi:hypothetical protein